MKNASVKTAKTTRAPKPTTAKRGRRKASDAQPQPAVALVESIDETEQPDSKPAKKGKAVKAEVPPPPCCCGCGIAVSKVGRQFRPGHDSRTHGMIKRAARGESVTLPKIIWDNFKDFGFLTKDKECRVWLEANQAADHQ